VRQSAKPSKSTPLTNQETDNRNMKFRVVLDFGPDTNCYSAVCPDLPGCSSAGVTEDQARTNIEEAIWLYLAPAEFTLPETAKRLEATVWVSESRPVGKPSQAAQFSNEALTRALPNVFTPKSRALVEVVKHFNASSLQGGDPVGDFGAILTGEADSDVVSTLIFADLDRRSNSIIKMYSRLLFNDSLKRIHRVVETRGLSLFEFQVLYRPTARRLPV